MKIMEKMFLYRVRGTLISGGGGMNVLVLEERSVR